MAQGQNNGFSEQQLALYTNEYYERADVVFRFGALLTASRDGGERVTEETFRLLIQDFARVNENVEPAKLLMSLAWKALNNLKSEKFHEWNAPIIQSMKSLGVEQRAVLFVVEMAGLELADAAKVFGRDESFIRKYLADAYKHLAVSQIRV